MLPPSFLTKCTMRVQILTTDCYKVIEECIEDRQQGDNHWANPPAYATLVKAIPKRFSIQPSGLTQEKDPDQLLSTLQIHPRDLRAALSMARFDSILPAHDLDRRPRAPSVAHGTKRRSLFKEFQDKTLA